MRLCANENVKFTVHWCNERSHPNIPLIKSPTFDIDIQKYQIIIKLKRFYIRATRQNLVKIKFYLNSPGKAV